MSSETDKYQTHAERDARHSALEEFSRDERRPAVILLSALVLASIFFAFGIMVGRWTTEGERPGTVAREDATPQTPPSQTPPSSNSVTTQQPASAPSAAPARPVDDKQRRYTLLVEDLKSSEAARSLAESMERAGYKDVRTRAAAGAGSSFSVLVGRYARDQADAEATRLRTKGGPRLRNVRVIEDPEP